MKTTLYYFSGTGNSLKIAMDLAERLQDTQLIPMAKLWQQDCIVADTERVGFVFPIYYFGLPDIVLEFVKKVELEKASYVFAVTTRGGTFVGSAVYRLQSLLNNKARTLNAAFKINMPDNYIPLNGSRSEEKQKEIFERAEKKTDEIAEIIKENGNTVENDIFPFKQIFLFVNNWCLKRAHGWDEKFYADDKCNFCGICEKICPVDNIILVDGKPQWQHECQQCMACIQFCPEEAIQYGSKTEKRKRYHHPDINGEDIMSQAPG